MCVVLPLQFLELHDVAVWRMGCNRRRASRFVATCIIEGLAGSMFITLRRASGCSQLIPLPTISQPPPLRRATATVRGPSIRTIVLSRL